MSVLRIATVITHSPFGKIRSNLAKLKKNVKDAKNRGAKIICFPEMNISGYGIGPEIINLAELVPGPTSSELSDIAVYEKIVILTGLVEKDSKGSVFASHLVIKPDKTIGVYRKLHIAPPECNFFTPGNKIPVFNACGINFGIQLCYDTHFPELTTIMALKGIDILFAPHASPNKTSKEKFKSWQKHLVARAYDNSIFVIACNQTNNNGKNLSFPGIAIVIGPSGKILKKDLSGREGMIIVDLKLDDLADIRNHRMRYFLPNGRPELYFSEICKLKL